MANIDLFRTDGLGPIGPASAEADQLVSRGMRAEQFRSLATLQQDEWQQLDEAVINAQLEVLTGVQDLIDANLTFSLPNGLGTTVLEWQDTDQMAGATVSMDGETEPQIDRVTYNTQGMPIPLIHHGWRLSARVLEASRRRGEAIDTTMADAASRQVAEKEEDIVFNGLGGLNYAGYQVEGYTTHPDRITASFQDGNNWDASAKTAVDIKDDVVNMIQQARNSNFAGPFVLYIPTNYDSVMEDDYTDGTGSGRLMTVRQRLEQFNSIRAVRTADKLSDDNVVMVQMSRNVVDLVQAVEPTTVEWESGSGMSNFFAVLSSRLPRVKSVLDASENRVAGIVHLS